MTKKDRTKNKNKLCVTAARIKAEYLTCKIRCALPPGNTVLEAWQLILQETQRRARTCGASGPSRLHKRIQEGLKSYKRVL
jgi:hypothetical protein